MTHDEIIAEIIPKIKRWVLGYITKKALPSRITSKHDRYEDLLNESIVRALEIIRGLPDPPLTDFDNNFDKFSTYIRLTTWTTIADYIRRDSVVKYPHSTRIVCETLQTKRAPVVPDHDIVVARETQERVFDACQDLRDSMIVQARLEGAITAAEVTEVTGLSESTVYRRLRDIRTRFGYE